MDEFRFTVKGDSGTYQVLFRKSGDNLTALCSCPAGQNGLYCKHRFEILEGKDRRIISGNKEDARTVSRMIAGTDVERALAAVAEAEARMEEAQTDLKGKKNTLARMMLD